ncbi:MAG: protein DpdD [Methylocystis sp.]
MISDLAPTDIAWLRAFFVAPNGVDWGSLEQRAAPQAIVDQILPWLHLVRRAPPQTPIVLPFVRSNEIVGWYATTRGPAGAFELKKELMGWLGPTYLDYFEATPENSSDPMAAAMRQRFGGTVFRFSGAAGNTTARIAERLNVYANLARRRPPTTSMPVRPVGAIRSDFEEALLVHDSKRAEALIAELRNTGRLNEENLRYLDVRLKAGLGLWPQIARDHWLIRTLADLPMPAQILADIIEALYRTYLDDLEAAGDAAALFSAFEQEIAKPYPRLFASRHGIKTPRVVKAFLLFERGQARPSAQILANLAALLPPDDPGRAVYCALNAPSSGPIVTETDESTADDAFDDGQFDRAFALFRALPLSKRSVQRLISCASVIGTDEARVALLEKIDRASSAFIQGLAEPIRNKIEGLRTVAEAVDANATGVAKITGWMDWAEKLSAGKHTGEMASAFEDVLTWDVTAFARDEALSRRFANLLGNLNDGAAAVARRAVPAIYNAFFPDGQSANQSTKVIVALLFDLIVLDEAISGTDLELLSLVLGQILAVGVTTKEYGSLLQDLEDVQRRIGSYAHLAWSLDVCEMLATAPVPSDGGREARLRLFLHLVSQTQGFAHRLKRQDVVPFEFLCRDFGLDPKALGAIRSYERSGVDIATPDLSGKKIAIYTLVEAAGRRAKQALEEMFPGVSVDINSDTVATVRLASLAKAADIFIFAWKSSSHQAFYCVKDALVDREPIMAVGKGSASILRAVLNRTGE